MLHDTYWTSSTRQILGLWFDDVAGVRMQSSMRLPPWFSNLLPEGALRDWIAADRGVSAARELELLLRVGTDLPGAVQVLEDAGAADGEAFEHFPSTRSASRSRPEREAEWRFSLAGVGLKFSMLGSGERLTLPGHDQLGDWIIKMPDPRHQHVPVNEYAMMTLAREVGIDVPQTRLIERDAVLGLPDSAWTSSESTAFAVSRFDRSENGSIHIEDFNQVRGFYPEDKYLGSYETVGALAYRGWDVESVREFTRRLVFSTLIGNGDAHLKNWSFIYRDGRRPSLSPAYDLVSTAAYTPRDQIEGLALKFGGGRRFSLVTRANLERLQARLGAEEADLASVARATTERFHEAWRAREADDRIAFVDSWIDDHLDATSAQFR